MKQITGFSRHRTSYPSWCRKMPCTILIENGVWPAEYYLKSPLTKDTLDNAYLIKQQQQQNQNSSCCLLSTPDSKVHGANMGPTWGRQDPGGLHVDTTWTLLSGTALGHDLSVVAQHTKFASLHTGPVLQGPIPLKNFHQLWWKIYFTLIQILMKLIVTYCCTWHDNRAVVASAKNCSDIIIRNGITVK